MGSDDENRNRPYPTYKPGFVPSKERRSITNADGDAQSQGKDSNRYGEMEKAQRKAEVSNQLRPKDMRPKESSLQACCMPFLGTKLLVSKYDREEYIRTTLAELAVYAVYLTVTCMITYGLTISSSYYYSNVISNLFLNTPINPPDDDTFRTSSTINDFWAFAATAMVKGLYWKYWYGVVDPAYAIPPQHQGVLHENRLLGRPRLRQLRVTTEPCPISDKFVRLFRECYPPYDRRYEETDVFSPTLGSLDAWRYQSEASLSETTHWGRLATYGGGGAIQVLGSDESETIQIINTLKNNLWLTRATRVVFLDFTLYNANVNLFCIVKLVWEFPATGGLITSWSIRTIRLIRYATPYEIFILVLEFIFIAFTIYYTLQEIFEMLSSKCKEYWSDFWTYLDMCILLISYTCIGFSIYRHILVEHNLEKLIKDPNIYANFYWLGFWESQFNNVVAVLVFLAWIKLFKYVSINRTMSQLSNTMSRCATDIGGFAIMFFIVFFAFAQLGYLLFGSKVEYFRTFYDTVFTLLRCILCDFNFRGIESANRVLGPIFFITNVFFVFFVLLNMFLAIINDTYNEVKAEANAHAQEYEVTDYIRQGFNSCFGNFGCRNRNLDAMNRAKLANTEHIIANDELRQNLRNCNYSDVEVEMFLTRYELDEDRPIDEAEAEHVLGSLEGYHSSDGRPTEANPMDKRQSESSSKQITDHEISELQTRVGVLESSLTAVNRKMDLLLTKLDVIKPRSQNLFDGDRSLKL